MSAVRRLSLVALATACLHLVFGAIVRISGSGMGCGDNWPKCYGYWFPPFNRPDLDRRSHASLSRVDPPVDASRSMALVAVRAGAASRASAAPAACFARPSARVAAVFCRGDRSAA